MSVASSAAVLADSKKSGAAQAYRVRPSAPPSAQANTGEPGCSSSVISPPSLTRSSLPPAASAIHSAPSASRHPPSAATLSWPKTLVHGAVGRQRAEFRPDPTVGQPAVLGQVERGAPVAERLVHDEHAVRGDHAAVREPQIVGCLGHGAVGVHPAQRRRFQRRAAHQIEPEVADVRPARARRAPCRWRARWRGRSGPRARPACRRAHGAGPCGRASTPPAGGRPAASRGRPAAGRRSASVRRSEPSSRAEKTWWR